MKLGEILYEETDWDNLRDQADKKHIDGKKTTTVEDSYEVDFVLFDEAGDEVEISAEAPSYPDVIEIEISDVESWDANPKSRSEEEEEIEYNYEDATVEISSSAKKQIKKWLSSRGDYVDVVDYEFDIDFDKQTGSVSATAVKDEMDVGKK